MSQLNTSLESALALDDEGGHWVTINSVHVHVKGGVIDQGPAHIEGKSLEQAAKEGYAVTAIHGAEKPTGQKFTPEQFKQLKTRIKKIMDEGAQKYAYVSHSKALSQAKKEMGLSDDTELALSASLAQCPHCESYDVTRMPGGEKVGPSDKCKRCGNQWSHKPGTLTAEQMNEGDEVGLADDEQVEASPMIQDGSPFILQLSDIGAGTPLPLVLTGRPKFNDAGKPIHYRKMLVASEGDWSHVGTGDPLPITRERMDEWVRNTTKMIAAGRMPFVPRKHNFNVPDAEDNEGFVLDLAREGTEAYATVALHGDEALEIAAKNFRSIGIKSNPRDANGNQYSGEWLHHLALVPNPALPNLGGMQAIAASADGSTWDVPVFDLSAVPPTSAPEPKGHRMNRENALQVRAKLGIGADVADDKLDDATAVKALSLSDSAVTLTTERDALKAERDRLATELTAKSQEVLSLSSDSPTNDPMALSLITRAFKTDRDRVIESGVVSEAGMQEIDRLMLSEGKPTRAALALSAGSMDPFYSRLCEILRQNPGIQTGNVIPKGATAATPVIAASADGDENNVPKEGVAASNYIAKQYGRKAAV